MLVPLQTSGNRPPLFFVHGVRGITFNVGARFAQMLGPDQPVYIIHANGMDGRQPVIESVPEMVTAYLQEIREARSTGFLRIGGMCSGCMVAIEIARALQEEGRRTGPVILVDPPVLTANYEKRTKAIDLSPEVQNRFAKEVRSWFIERKLYPDEIAEKDLPFDPLDSNQLHLATVVAARTTVAFAKYTPQSFSGSVGVFVSEDRAPAFFHPQMPWHNLLCGRRVVHVLPWSHMDLFQPEGGRKIVARLMKLMLEEDSAESLTERKVQPPLVREARP